VTKQTIFAMVTYCPSHANCEFGERNCCKVLSAKSTIF